MVKIKKLALITFFIVILYSISVSAALNIVESSVTLAGTPGQALSSSFNVNNTGTAALNINFTIPTLSYSTHSLGITSFDNITNLASAATYITSFSVAIPSQKRAGLYTGILTATANDTATDTVTLNVNVTPSYSVSATSSVNVGSASLNSTVGSTFTITNNGNEDLTSVSFSFSSSGYNLQSNRTAFTLAYNTTETIKFNVTIPSSSSTGNVTLGSITFVSTEHNTTITSVKSSVGGGLEIQDLDVFLTTRESNLDNYLTRKEPKTGSHTDVQDGNKLNFGDEKVGPESELRFNFDIENTFTDDEGKDINDIVITITIVDIDDGSDIDEESKEIDLDPDSTEVEDIYVNIPLSVDEGVYDVLIEVVGEDDDGNEHTVEWSLELDIDKESRDIPITKLTIFPEKIKCSGTAALTATITNLGKRLEDDARLDIINSDLGINVVEKSITLEEDPFDDDNQFTRKTAIVVTQSTKSGTYPITVKSYLQDGLLWETKIEDFVVEVCSNQQIEVEEEQEQEKEETETTQSEGSEESSDTETSQASEGAEIPVLKQSSTTEVPLTQRGGFWFAVILLNIAVFGGAGYFLYLNFIKK